MHVLLTAIGSYGDVHPMIGVGVALRRRGHEVTLITNPHFADEVARAGLQGDYVSTAEEYDEVTSHPDIWHGRRGVSLIFAWAAERLLRPIYERIAELHRPGETVLAAHPLDIASRVAHESLGVPVVSVVFAPLALWSDASPPRMSGAPVGPGYPVWWNRLWLWIGEQVVMRRVVRPPLAAVRRGLGLRPAGRLFPDWWYGTGHTLALFPDWFVNREAELPADWPTGAAAVGFPLWDGAGGEGAAAASPDLEGWLDWLADRPPLVFTPGSANRAASRFFHAAVDACGRLGRHGLLLTKYPDQLPSHLPKWVRHESFVPLSRVLPRAAAFVHHGGIGSCAQGLAAGVPQLIHPMAYDQHDNAMRLERLGVGATLAPRGFTGRAVAGVLREMLASPRGAERRRLLAAKCDGAAALDLACDYFERLATERGLR